MSEDKDQVVAPSDVDIRNVRRQLEHERFIREVLDIRQGASAKPAWQTFLESAGGVALITVLLGGLFTAWITDLMQEGARERDFQNEMIGIHGADQLVVHRQYLSKREAVLRESLELAGSVLGRAQSVVDVDRRSFASRRSADSNKKLAAQKEDIRRQHNETANTWAARKGALGPLIDYYFGEQALKQWHQLVLDVDAYVVCAEAHRPSREDVDGCLVPQKQDAEGALTLLIAQISKTSDPPWLTVEEVRRIRHILSASRDEPSRDS